MKHLLIIEDDKIDQMAFERFAKNERFPFTYQFANSIKEAKLALKNHKFDLILTDYFLGDGTMFEMLDLKLDIPVIVTTGTGNELIAVKAIQNGAFDYLIKDIDGNYLKILPVTIKNALHHFETEKKNKIYQSNLEFLVEERTKDLKQEITKSKTLENALTIERDKFNFILEALPIGVSLIDKENEITYFNQKSLEIEQDFNHNQNMIGKEVLSTHEPQFRENVQNLIDDFKSDKQSVLIRETKRDGNDFEISYHTIRDSKANYMGLLRLVSNITQRKQTEQALRQSEEMLRETQKIAGLGTYSINISTGIWTSSEILDKIFGIEANYDKSVKGWVSIVHPDYQKIMNDYLIEEVIGKKIKFDKEYKIIRKSDNKERWVHGIGKLQFDDNLNPIMMLGTIQDITHRKQAEQAHINSEIKYHELFTLMRLMSDTMPDLVWVKDLENKYIFANKAMCSVLLQAKNTNEPVGKTDLFFAERAGAMHPENPQWHTFGEQCANTDVETLKQMKPMQFDEYGNVNGKFIFLDVHKTPLFNNEGKLIGVVGSARDITEQKKIEQVNKVIFNITKKASEKVSLKKLFNYIRLELGTLMNTNNFFIALYDKKTDMISTPYMVDELDDNSFFPKGESLTGHVIDSKKSLFATHQELLNLIKDRKVKASGPLSRCWLGVPLLLNNEAIGAMVIQSYTDENAYTQKDAALLELIAQNISQVIKHSRDFEKIYLLNQALKQSEEAVIITDLNGAINYVNPAFERLSGYAEQEVLGLNPRLLKSGEQPPEFYETLWNTILSGETWNGEFINKRKDNSRYLIQVNISPVKNKENIITHFIAVQADITEKRKLERDFIHAFIDAQEQEKQSFGEDLHDGISQILSAESMYIQVLRMLVKSSDKRIVEALDKIASLNIDAITDARNIAHGLMSKQLKEVGLLLAIEHICIDYTESRKIAFNYKHSGVVEADFNKDLKTNLFRIVQEVSTNTIRHSLAKNMDITLSRLDENTIKLVLKDDGVGIDFEKMKRENKGAGLKNVERRVILLNGKSTLESAPNKGTCYTITVPLQSVK